MSHSHLSVHNRCIWKRFFNKSKFLYVKSFYIRCFSLRYITSSAAKPEAGRNILILEGAKLHNKHLQVLLSTLLHCRSVLGCPWALCASCCFHLSHHWIPHLSLLSKQHRYGQGVGLESWRHLL